MSHRNISRHPISYTLSQKKLEFKMYCCRSSELMCCNERCDHQSNLHTQNSRFVGLDNLRILSFVSRKTTSEWEIICQVSLWLLLSSIITLWHQTSWRILSGYLNSQDFSIGQFQENKKSLVLLSWKEKAWWVKKMCVRIGEERSRGTE